MNAPEAVIPGGGQRGRGRPGGDAFGEGGLSVPRRNLSATPAISHDSTRDNRRFRDAVANSRAIEVHIEELVLHGVPPNDRWEIGDAVGQELARLLGQSAVPVSLRTENAMENLKAPTFKPALGAKPPTIGRQIAQAIYKGFSQ